MGFHALNSDISMQKIFSETYNVELKIFTQYKDKTKATHRDERGFWPRWSKKDQIYPFP